MKIISLNMEGRRHFSKVRSLVATEEPEVICLMEAPSDGPALLNELGYHTTYAPTMLREQDGEVFPEGVLLATKIPHQAKSLYYHGDGTTLQIEDRNNFHDTVSRAVIVATVADFTIATTHFTWTPRGEEACIHQITHLASLLALLKDEPPHILCGDFNIPRNLNVLYTELCKYYTDTVPAHYSSSLDRAFHNHGSNPDRQMLFDTFMVDYLFTMPPYSASTVRLQFGLSDHAAILATLSKASLPNETN